MVGWRVVASQTVIRLSDCPLGRDEGKSIMGHSLVELLYGMVN